MPCRLTTTRSSPTSSSRCCLKLSLITRLIRFRSTARRLFFFDTANPKRASSRPLGTARTKKNLSTDRRPSLKTRRYSSGFNNLRQRGNGYPCLLGKGRVSECQSGPSLCAARLEHLASVARGHACTETVGTRLFQIAGLKRSLHSCLPVNPLKISVNYGRKKEA